jgi:hypothetical protein
MTWHTIIPGRKEGVKIDIVNEATEQRNWEEEQ